MPLLGSHRFSQVRRASRLGVASLLLSVAACADDGADALDTPTDVPTLSQVTGDIAAGARAIERKRAEYDGTLLSMIPSAPAFELYPGVMQSFGATVIVWSPATGAHPIWNLPLKTWAEGGVSVGLTRYGFPIDDGNNAGDPKNYCKGRVHVDVCQYYSNNFALCMGDAPRAIVCDNSAVPRTLPPITTTGPQESQVTCTCSDGTWSSQRFCYVRGTTIPRTPPESACSAFCSGSKQTSLKYVPIGPCAAGSRANRF